MRTVAVVPAYRSDVPLRGLLRDLEVHEPTVDVVVVDDRSPGGPPAVPDSVRLVVTDENRGFGGACNRGVQEAQTDFGYVAFLNPDVRLVAPSLSQIVEHLETRASVGIATGPVVDERGDRVPSAWGPPSAARALVFAAGWKLRWARSLLARTTPTRGGAAEASVLQDELSVQGHVLGGAMIVRRSCFEHLGGFDPDFFLFWEDADLCARARAAGWQVAVLPCTPIVHRQGTSSEGVTAAQRWDWYVDGARTYARKHLTAHRGHLLLLGLRIGRLLRRRR